MITVFILSYFRNTTNQWHNGLLNQ
uniref:Uncharacterized protein n=1 Tax=Rhizophora mucronata TaxID=61149 RepID=A0A2P2KYR5_RHIMU